MGTAACKGDSTPRQPHRLAVATYPVAPGEVTRAHLHDYWVVDGVTGRDIAGFATARSGGLPRPAPAGRRGDLLTTVHPAGCDRAEAPAAGRRGRESMPGGATQ